MKRRLIALAAAGALAAAMPVAAVSAHNDNCGVLPLINCQIDNHEGEGGFGGAGGGGQQQQQQQGGGGGGGGGSSSSSSSSASAGAAGAG